MKVTKVLIAGIAALALVASALAAMATFTAAPAKADIGCPNGFVPPSVSPDCYFLYMMARDNIQADSQAGLVSVAHVACADMAADTGRDPVMDEIPIMQRANPALTTQKAALFAGIAAAAYCPQVIRR
jgi:Protein of unknown function (DUF732)